MIADSLGETDCTFLANLYRAEQAIAEKLLALSRAKLPWGSIDADKALPWNEQRIGIELAPSQKAAVRLALTSKVLVITGGPGVGKTTIVNAILRILAAPASAAAKASLAICSGVIGRFRFISGWVKLPVTEQVRIVRELVMSLSTLCLAFQY